MDSITVAPINVKVDEIILQLNNMSVEASLFNSIGKIRSEEKATLVTKKIRTIKAV